MEEEFELNSNDFPPLSSKKKEEVQLVNEITNHTGSQSVEFDTKSSNLVPLQSSIYNPISLILSMKLVYKLLINNVITKNEAIGYCKILYPNSKAANSTNHEIIEILKSWAIAGTYIGV